MGLEIPDEVRWLSWIVGQDWPEGDETAMRRLADAWDAAAVEVEELTGELQVAATRVLGVVDGEAADQFRAYWERFVGTDPRVLPRLAQMCRGLAEECRSGANEIEYGKYMFIALLIVTAIEIVMLIEAAFATFGASTAGIPAVEAAAQVTSRTIGRQLLTQVLKAAGRGVVENVGLDVLVQGMQIVQGNRQGLDLGKTGAAALDGAIGGAISGGVGVGMGRIPGLSGADTALGDLAQGAVRGGLSEAVSGAASTVAGAAIHGEDLSLRSLAMGTTSGAFGGATDGATGGQHGGGVGDVGPLHPDQGGPPAPTAPGPLSPAGESGSPPSPGGGSDPGGQSTGPVPSSFTGPAPSTATDPPGPAGPPGPTPATPAPSAPAPALTPAPTGGAEPGTGPTSPATTHLAGAAPPAGAETGPAPGTAAPGGSDGGGQPRGPAPTAGDPGQQAGTQQAGTPPTVQTGQPGGQPAGQPGGQPSSSTPSVAAPSTAPASGAPPGAAAGGPVHSIPTAPTGPGAVAGPTASGGPVAPGSPATSAAPTSATTTPAPTPGTPTAAGPVPSSSAPAGSGRQDPSFNRTHLLDGDPADTRLSGSGPATAPVGGPFADVRGPTEAPAGPAPARDNPPPAAAAPPAGTAAAAPVPARPATGGQPLPGSTPGSTTTDRTAEPARARAREPEPGGQASPDPQPTGPSTVTGDTHAPPPGTADADADARQDSTPPGPTPEEQLRAAEDEARQILAPLGQNAPTVDFTSNPIDPAAAHAINDALRGLLDYPGVVAQLRAIGSTDPDNGFTPGSDELAYALTSGPDRGIYVNPDEFGDAARLSADTAGEVATGWSVPGGDGPDGIVNHEFGHQLGQAVLNNPHALAALNQAVSNVLGLPYDASQPMHDPAVQRAVEQALSEYGGTDPHEMMAEAFAEYRSRHTPRPLAQAVGDVFDRYFGGPANQPGQSGHPGHPGQHQPGPPGPATPGQQPRPRLPDASAGTPNEPVSADHHARLPDPGSAHGDTGPPRSSGTEPGAHAAQPDGERGPRHQPPDINSGELSQVLERLPVPEDGSLIDDVGGQPIADYLRELGEERANALREARTEGTVTRGEVGNVSAVAVDRRTGAVAEGVNGRPANVIAEADLHPLLRDRLAQIHRPGGYPRVDPQTGAPVLDNSGNQILDDYPYFDHPLGHAEVRAVNALLHLRDQLGVPVDQSTFAELRVDNFAPFLRNGVAPIECCPNCSALLRGTPSTAGRYVSLPKIPANRLPE